MKLLIAIPSKNRVDTLVKYSWTWAKELKIDVRVFVEPQDYDNYLSAIPEGSLVKIGANNAGLGYAKKCIQLYAESEGYDVVMKLDDDISGWTWMRKPMTTEAVERRINNLLIQFVHNELGAVAFPYSFQIFDMTEYWSKAKKVQSTYMVRTELLCSPYEFSVFEDFAVGLYALVKGFKVMKYNLMGQVLGVPVGGGTGGHQSFDRSELALKDAELLKKIYPPITFRKVEKPWKIEPDMKSVKL